MAALHFEFVSPERVLFSGDVDQVDLPGSEGDMGILPQHAPLVTTLRPGIVTIFNQGRREEIVVVGGFAEVSPAGLTILADSAEPRENFDMTMLASQITDAEEDLADAEDDAQRDKLRRRLDQLKSLQAALGTASGATLGASSGAQRPDAPRRRDAPH
jgi:F-type H+-transporting ATPase subunit epsilon